MNRNRNLVSITLTETQHQTQISTLCAGEPDFCASDGSGVCVTRVLLSRVLPAGLVGVSPNSGQEGLAATTAKHTNTHSSATQAHSSSFLTGSVPVSIDEQSASGGMNLLVVDH